MRRCPQLVAYTQTARRFYHLARLRCPVSTRAYVTRDSNASMDRPPSRTRWLIDCCRSQPLCFEEAVAERVCRRAGMCKCFSSWLTIIIGKKTGRSEVGETLRLRLACITSAKLHDDSRVATMALLMPVRRREDRGTVISECDSQRQKSERGSSRRQGLG